MQRAPECRVRWNEWRVKSRERRRGWGVDAARPQGRAEARESWGLVGQRKDDWSECGFCSRNFRKPVGGLGGGPVEEDARTGTQGCQKAEQRLSWGPLRELSESPPASGARLVSGCAKGEAASGYFCSCVPVTSPGRPLHTRLSSCNPGGNRGAQGGQPAVDALRDLGGWEGRGGWWLLARFSLHGQTLCPSRLILRGGVRADEATLVHKCLDTWFRPARKRRNGSHTFDFF